MSNILFPQVGVQGPAQLSQNQTHGGLVSVTNGATPYSQGHVMRLTPGKTTAVSYDDFDPTAFDEFTTISAPSVPTDTDVGADQASAVFGVLMQDLAANETGWVMVRGLCLAMTDVLTTTLTLDSGMYVGAGATTNTLQNIRDAATGVNVKVIARSRYDGSVASGAAIGLYPVAFNGVEGFGWHVGV